MRDSGLVHALLNIPDKETLLAHPVVGQSWECFVIENMLVCAANKAQGGRGFHAACADLMPTKKFVIYPGEERYRLASDIEVISLKELAIMLAEA